LCADRFAATFSVGVCQAENNTSNEHAGAFQWDAPALLCGAGTRAIGRKKKVRSVDSQI